MLQLAKKAIFERLFSGERTAARLVNTGDAKCVELNELIVSLAAVTHQDESVKEDGTLANYDSLGNPKATPEATPHSAISGAIIAVDGINKAAHDVIWVCDKLTKIKKKKQRKRQNCLKRYMIESRWCKI